jgi:hypothetical protein
MPKGVRLVQWPPKVPPVAIESCSVVTDVPQFIQTTLGHIYKSLIGIEGERSDAQFDHNCLLPEHDMDRILRYEESMHRQIDWAVQKPLECQERRKTLNLTASASVLTIDESSKRSP